jgi:hypothetical protein
MKNEHFEALEPDPTVVFPPNEELLSNEEQENSAESIMGRLLPLLTPHSSFGDVIYGQVYQFSPGCANREDEVILNCLQACSENEREEVAQTINAVTLGGVTIETRRSGAEQIANILFNSSHVNEKKEALSIKMDLMQLLAKSHTVFSDKLYTQLYMYDPGCANREDEVVSEHIMSCNENELRSIERLINGMHYPDIDVGEQSDIAGEIAKILFKTVH